MPNWTVIQGDACRLPLADSSVDSIVCDPPYGLEFMGKIWDAPWKYGITEFGFADNKFRKPAPQFQSSRNPMCRGCRKHKRGSKSHERCVCKNPDYDETDHRLGDMAKLQTWHQAWATECLRVLKPGGHLLAFGGSRTYHRLACAIEDAGFEIRDQIQWLYGSGFPKSLDVSKAIDRMRDDNAERQAVGCWLRQHREAKGLTQKTVAAYWPSVTGGLTGCVANWELGFNCPTWDQWLALKAIIGFSEEMDAEVWRLNGRKGQPGDNWAEREVIGKDRNWGSAGTVPLTGYKEFDLTTPATDAAKQWEGWGTALKPAHEPIVLARKPLIGTVAENVLQHGTGALNIERCRIETGESLNGGAYSQDASERHDGVENWRYKRGEAGSYTQPVGRWPANVVHDGSEEVLAGFPETESGSGQRRPNGSERVNTYQAGWKPHPYEREGDSGSVARFFYCAKATQDDRNEGLEDLPLQSAGTVTDRKDGSAGLNSPRAGAGRVSGSRNNHPTVKPTDLMRYLCRLITPPGGVVLDPFCGSGSTGKAAMLEHFHFIGIELSAEYCELAQRRIEAVTRQGVLFA